jgi:tetratricopeptide (TPR) repeat protein
MDLNRTDRIGELLTGYVKDFVFDELSEEYLKKAGVYDILKDVPVPIRRTEMTGITVLKIALNMAFVIGCDPNFKYRDNYVKYILKNFDKRFSDGLLAQGMDRAEKSSFEEAVIDFRAAILVDPDNAKAYYCYGRGLKDCYEKLLNDEQDMTSGISYSKETEDMVGRYKAESLEAFEVATLKDPDLAEAYYYLGYAYLNMGLYLKAKLTWETYVKLGNETDFDKLTDKARKSLEESLKEISQRLEQLEQPVKIEEGYNMILSGKFEDGIKVLRPYTESDFKNWWPLWFYLGTAYKELAAQSRDELLKAEPEADAAKDDVVVAASEEAVKNFLEVLKLSPSNRDAMEELVKLYRFLGNDEKVNKYETKLKIVEENAEADRELIRHQAQKDAGVTNPVKMS